MPSKVQCQFCGFVNRVGGGRDGGLVDCAKCGARLIQPDLDPDPHADPDMSSFGQHDDEDFIRLPGRRFWIMLFGGLAAVGILALMINFVWVAGPRFLFGPNQPRPRRAAPPVARRMPPPPRARFPNAPGQFANRFGGNQRGGLLPNNRPFHLIPDQDAPSAAPVPWKVVVDAPPPAAALPADLHVNIPIPEGPNPVVVFPDTPSTMVCVGNVGHDREFREVWDLRTNQKIGTTRGLRTLSEKINGFFRPVSALSADGRLFVTQGLGPFDLVAWDVAHEKPLRVLNPERANTAGLSYAALAGERLLAFGPGTPFQVLDVATPSQKRMQKFPRPAEFDRKSLAISPGGRYVAVFHNNQVLPGMLRFYDVESGTPAGQLPLPKFDPAGPTICEAVAFSPDGREVAALFDYRNNSQLVCWDLGQGWLTDHIAFDGNLRMILGGRLAYLFPPLEWFPDRKRWLVYGRGIVDRGLRKVVWNIPDEPNRMRYGIRHLASADCVLSVTQQKDRFVLGSLRLPLREIDRVAEFARVSGELTDKELPPLTAAKFSAARTISLEEPAPDWKVAPDPGPTLKPESLAQPMPVTPFEGKLQRLSIAIRPEGAAPPAIVAVLASATDSRESKFSLPQFPLLNSEIARRLVPHSTHLQADEFGGGEPLNKAGGAKPVDKAGGGEPLNKTGGGKLARAIEIPFDCHLLAVSPDGSLALTASTETPQRLDVWSPAKGDHLVGWQPKEGADLVGMHVVAGTIVDATHVVTQSGAAELVGWEIPACRATYRIRPVPQFVCSPTHKYLALPAAGRIRFHDARTGACLGSVAAASFGRPAFHPSGARLASVINRDNELWFVCWNLRDGTVETEFPVPVAGIPLHWCGDNQLLANNASVIDVARRRVIWRYEFPTSVAPSEQPAARHWFFTPAGDAGGKLQAVALPDAQVIAQLLQPTPQPEMVLEPGGKISVEFDSPEPPPFGTQYEKDVRRHVADYYRPHKIDVQDGQPVKLQFHWSYIRTGAMANKRIQPPGRLRGRELVSIPEIKIDTSVAIVWQDKKLWTTRTIHSSNFGQQWTSSGEQLEALLAKQRWQLVLATFMNAKPPAHVFAPGANGGLGTSQLSLGKAAP